VKKAAGQTAAFVFRSVKYQETEMLQRTPFTTLEPPVQAVQIRTGQSISKSARYRTPRQRAREAAEWVTGGKVVQPSTKLAASVFQVSAQLVAEEVIKMGGVEILDIKSLADRLWKTMSQTERADFLETHQTSIWAVLDRITA
jgi:hypothetical protein